MASAFISRFSLTGLLLAAAFGSLFAQSPSTSSARPSTPIAAEGSSRQAAKPTIVLVHGAFADGTGWQHVIPLLERDGYTVIAVQNPLTSLAADVETTKRVIDVQPGPVVAVGHSYGGAVITGAAAGNAHVKALVYIAAFAPDAGEPIGAFGEKYPAALGQALRPDAAGFLYIDRKQFRELFAKDVPLTEAQVMAATQKPIIGSAFGSSVPQAAWKTIPSWYLVAQQDQAINPDLERFYAKRMGAKTSEINSSHVPFISHPAEVAQLIEQVASTPAVAAK
ncbi:MAG: alpha/beta hydrolase [Hymenobacter sp.]|nr:alpha/beta hydrolase [Hymenobacter sp.]